VSAEESYKHCEALAREHMRDHWIGALFAPEDKRRHLHALAAFAFETGRIKALVKEPLAGEVRLTWWIEAIEGVREGEAQSHPVAAALLATVVAAKLPKPRVEDWLLARRDDLYRDAPADLPAAQALEAPLFALSAIALGGQAEAAALKAAEAQFHLAAARPAEALVSLDGAEAALADARGDVLPAFAPLAALRLDARRALRGKEPAPGWRRQIAMWWWGRGR
jgi:hypothetical protein